MGATSTCGRAAGDDDGTKEKQSSLYVQKKNKRGMNMFRRIKQRACNSPC